MAARSLGTLSIDLIARVGGFVGGLNDAERASEDWRRKVESNVKAAGAAIGTLGTLAAGAALAVGAAGISFLKTTAEQVTESDRLAKALKMSTQDLLAWQFAAEKAGLSGDNIADIFKDIGDKIGDAVLNKSGEAVDALNSLGLSAEKLSKISPDKQLLAIGGALEKIGTNAEKITILESLGNDLSKLLPLFDNNNEKLEQFIQLSKDYGVAPDPSSIDDLVKVNGLFQDMEDQAKGLKMEIAGGLAKVDLSGLQTSFGKLHDVLTDPKILQGLTSLVSGVVDLASGLASIAASAGDLIDNFKGHYDIGDSQNEAVIKNRLKWLEEARKTSDSIETIVERTIGTMPSSEEIDKEISELTSRLDSLRKAGSALPTKPASVSSLTSDNKLGAGETNGKTTPNAGAQKLDNAFKSTEQNYMRQIALIDTVSGKTKEATELQKIQFDISDGRLSSLNEAQKTRLESLATEIDRLNVMSKFKDLQEELLTPEEKLLEKTRERVKLLREASKAGFVNDDDYQKAAGAIAKDSFTDSPHFGGIDALYGGQSGELRKTDEAQKELEKWYQTQLDMLAENRQSQSDLNQQWDAQELALKKKHSEELAGIEESRKQLIMSSVTDGLGSVVDLTKTAYGEQSGIYKAAFAVQKAAAIAQSAMAIQQGIAMAAANPFPYNLAAMASVAASTAGIVSNIAAIGMAHDGIDSVPETGTWLLQKGERVTTASTSAKLDATLDRVGRQSAGGGNYNTNVEMHINGDPDAKTIALMEEAVRRGARQGYQQVTGDLATGRGDVSKALGGAWSTKRRVG